MGDSDNTNVLNELHLDIYKTDNIGKSVLIPLYYVMQLTNNYNLLLVFFYGRIVVQLNATH